MSSWIALLICFGVCLAASSVGFKKYVYFLSIGYGFSVSATGLALTIIYAISGQLSLLTLLACIILVAYGLRLSLFLLIRELKNASYRKTLEGATKTEKPIPGFVLVSMWILCAGLYVMQTSGVLFAIRANNGGFFNFDVAQLIGLVIMVAAIVIEALADKQKSDQKKENPNMVATKGLYKITRCPNYYGEILFWTGVVVFSCTSLVNWWKIVIVALAYVMIVYIMFNGAKRLEKRQEERYSGNEEFEAYIKKTPIMIFLVVPVKSLKNSKIVK